VSDSGTRRCLARTPRRPSSGLFKAACPQISPIRALAARAPCAAVARNPSRRCCVPSPSSQSRRREAVQGLRQKVRNPPALLVTIPAHCSTRKPSPEFPTRRCHDGSRLRRALVALAAPSCFVVPRAARSCSACLKSSSGALDRVRRRAPPLLAAGRHCRPTPSAAQPHACVLCRRIQIRYT
jgi:hypothetical protein